MRQPHPRSRPGPKMRRVRKAGPPEPKSWAVMGGRYRYALGRCWDPRLPRICWVMLNPSTANATRDDATLRRVLRFSREWGYGRLEVVNLFALRSTDPWELRADRFLVDPVGQWCNVYLDRAVGRASVAVAAWGSQGGAAATARAAQVVQRHSHRLWQLSPVAKGAPRHPLYARADSCLEQLTERPTQFLGPDVS